MPSCKQTKKRKGSNKTKSSLLVHVLVHGTDVLHWRCLPASGSGTDFGMVHFSCQLVRTTVPRYLVKHFEYFCEGVFVWQCGNVIEEQISKTGPSSTG